MDVGRAGALQGQPSSGCNAGLAANSAIYGNSSLYNNVGPEASANNSASDLNTPLYGNANAGMNLPLYGNPLAGDNVPLYSSLTPGVNAPLYTNSSLNNNSSLNGRSQEGGVANAGSPSCRSGIPLGEWLIYPSIRVYSIYSDNLFLAPSGPVNAWAFGATPTITANWSNGIHTTTIYAKYDTERYPTDNMIDTSDRQFTFSQKYSPLPDLTFNAVGDYSHSDITTSLTESIPNPIIAPVTAPTQLPNGDIELPNGEIVSPTGQVVGNIFGPPGRIGVSVINPSDQYTGTATVSKIFNRAVLTLSGSWAQRDYESTQGTGDGDFSSYTTQTYTEHSAVWLGPMLYAYSNGAFSTHTNNGGIDPYSQAYNVVAGVGTAQFSLFQGSAYVGYQGSNSDGSGQAGGAKYGVKVSYFPALAWTIVAAIDETINKASGTGVSNLALDVNSPVQIALSSSTRIIHPSVQTQYQIAPQWTAVGNLSYTHIDYYGSQRLDQAWDASLQLSYEIWRNMTLTWEYEYTDVLSNAPGNNATRNFFMTSANYRF